MACFTFSRSKTAFFLSFGLLALSGCSGSVRNVDGGDGDGDGSCELGGETYENGETWQPVPGCGGCGCEDGEVWCNDIACAGLSCESGGVTYADGETWQDPSTCGFCECVNGDASCAISDLGCPEVFCEYGGQVYSSGDEFPAGDGCNSCYCDEMGNVGCTTAFCGQPDPCGLSFEVGVCDAAFPVFWHNPETGICEPQTYGGCGGNDNRFESAEECQDACGGSIPMPPPQSCVVGGIEYPHGAQDVPDPFSCNTCSCNDGTVSGCTEVFCPNECPPNSVEGTQCAACGPADECLGVETKCLQVCETSDECSGTGGLCWEGVCKNVCG